MIPRPEYQRSLDDLAALLRRSKRPLTAREIATALKCSIPTAYKRLRGLHGRGESVYTKTAGAKQTGPRAEAYGLR